MGRKLFDRMFWFCIGAGTFMLINSIAGPTVDEVKTFYEEGKPTVTRLYHNLGIDKLMVDGRPLEIYLDKMKSTEERRHAEDEIRQRANWYTE